MMWNKCMQCRFGKRKIENGSVANVRFKLYWICLSIYGNASLKLFILAGSWWSSIISISVSFTLLIKHQFLCICWGSSHLNLELLEELIELLLFCLDALFTFFLSESNVIVSSSGEYKLAYEQQDHKDFIPAEGEACLNNCLIISVDHIDLIVFSYCLVYST